MGSVSQTSGNLLPATITNLDSGAVVTCMFRPKEYTFTKSNVGWEPSKAPGRTMDPPSYSGGSPMTLSMELWFDTYENVPGARDVRSLTNQLWTMTNVDPSRTEPQTNTSEPPKVEFRWGTTWSFKAVISSITQHFTLFDPDGTPVRSKVNLTFLQAAEVGRYPGQNPTSGGHNGYAVYQVTEGETIDQIAFKQYGSSNVWRHLAEANSLDDPGRLYGGQRLVLVPLES